METIVYVQDIQGKPMMPTSRAGWVRRTLKFGRARVVTSMPFTIRLMYEPETYELQPVVCGTDPGRTNIGTSAVRDDGKCLYTSECVTRNKEIPKLMADRRRYRQASRRGERLARKRLAKRLGTTTKKLLRRILPGCGEPVMVKDIINTEARFNNRKRVPGWLTPTATQLLRTHTGLLKQVMRVLPVTDVVLEINRFAFMCLDNPEMKKYEINFQEGPLYGQGGVKAAVSAMQEGCCLMCGAGIEHYHHIQPRSQGGSDTMGNIAGLCQKCHERVHKDIKYQKALESRKARMNKKYGALSVLNQIIPQLVEEYLKLFPGHVHVTNGWNTKQYREDHCIAKGHGIDAYCIACSILPAQRYVDVPDTVYHIQQFRRHDRSNIHGQRERIYCLDGKKVAVNRNKRMDQTNDSLREWHMDMTDRYGISTAKAMLSRLTVKKSIRHYNRKGRLLPGAVFLYEGKRYVMTGQLSNGQYYRAYGCGNKNFPANKCIVIQKCGGLVYVGKQTA